MFLLGGPLVRVELCVLVEGRHLVETHEPDRSQEEKLLVRHQEERVEVDNPVATGEGVTVQLGFLQIRDLRVELVHDLPEREKTYPALHSVCGAGSNLGLLLEQSLEDERPHLLLSKVALQEYSQCYLDVDGLDFEPFLLLVGVDLLFLNDAGPSLLDLVGEDLARLRGKRGNLLQNLVFLLRSQLVEDYVDGGGDTTEVNEVDALVGAGAVGELGPAEQDLSAVQVEVQHVMGVLLVHEVVEDGVLPQLVLLHRLQPNLELNPHLVNLLSLVEVHLPHLSGDGVDAEAAEPGVAELGQAGDLGKAEVLAVAVLEELSVQDGAARAEQPLVEGGLVLELGPILETAVRGDVGGVARQHVVDQRDELGTGVLVLVKREVLEADDLLLFSVILVFEFVHLLLSEVHFSLSLVQFLDDLLLEARVGYGQVFPVENHRQLYVVGDGVGVGLPEEQLVDVDLRPQRIELPPVPLQLP